LILIERKTLRDLAASIKDKRYCEQSLRLQHNENFHNHNIMYLIEGSFKFYEEKYTRISKTALISAMTTLQYFKGFSLMRTFSIQDTFDIIIGYANKIAKENNKELFYNKNSKTIPLTCDYVSVIKNEKKANITADNIGSIMLSQIPGVSYTYAEAILKNFESFQDFVNKLQTEPDCTKGLKYTTKTGISRSIPQSCIYSIHQYIISQPKTIINIDTS
jgi:ERCC4-type nuclease